MSQKSVQDAFLNNIRRGQGGVTVFLTNGVKLSGKITWFDNFCLTLERDGNTQLVYKHAIATVMPEVGFRIYDLDGFDEAGNI